MLGATPALSSGRSTRVAAAGEQLTDLPWSLVPSLGSEPLLSAARRSVPQSFAAESLLF